MGSRSAELGIFESLPAHQSASALADSIQSSASRYYGIAGPKFVELLLRQERSALKDKVKKLIEKFFKYHNVEKGNGIAVRIAKRFALAYASAKRLAVQYKILLFNEDDIMEGISRCYNDATVSKLDEDKNIFTAEFIEAVMSDNIPDLTTKSVDEAMIEQLKVVMTEVKGVSAFAVDRSFLADNVVKNFNNTIDFLRQIDVLYGQMDKGKFKSTRPLHYKAKNFSRRYFLRREALLKFIKE